MFETQQNASLRQKMRYRSTSNFDSNICGNSGGKQGCAYHV